MKPWHIGRLTGFLVLTYPHSQTVLWYKIIKALVSHRESVTEQEIKMTNLPLPNTLPISPVILAEKKTPPTDHQVRIIGTECHGGHNIFLLTKANKMKKGYYSGLFSPSLSRAHTNLLQRPFHRHCLHSEYLHTWPTCAHHVTAIRSHLASGQVCS